MPWIVDTVVIRNFLLVGRLDILLQLAGGMVYVPPLVLDADDFRATAASTPVTGWRSDLGKGLWYYRERLSRANLCNEDVELFSARLARFECLPDFVRQGQIRVTELEDGELIWFARLLDRGFLRSRRLKRLQSGESACLAVAICRNWVLATDDEAALEALSDLSPGHPYVRTRQLLEEAVRRGVLTCSEAKGLHQSMVHVHGFQDTGSVSC